MQWTLLRFYAKLEKHCRPISCHWFLFQTPEKTSVMKWLNTFPCSPFLCFNVLIINVKQILLTEEEFHVITMNKNPTDFCVLFFLLPSNFMVLTKMPPQGPNSYPGFWKICRNFDHLWYKFLIKNVVLGVFRWKNTHIFPVGLSLMSCGWFIKESTLIPKTRPLPWKIPGWAAATKIQFYRISACYFKYLAWLLQIRPSNPGKCLPFPCQQ